MFFGLYWIVKNKKMAGVPGFEPGMAIPKTAALPLGYTPTSDMICPSAFVKIHNEPLKFKRKKAFLYKKFLFFSSQSLFTEKYYHQLSDSDLIRVLIYSR